MGLEPVLFRERVHRLTVYTLFEDTSAAADAEAAAAILAAVAAEDATSAGTILTEIAATDAAAAGELLATAAATDAEATGDLLASAAADDPALAGAAVAAAARVDAPNTAAALSAAAGIDAGATGNALAAGPAQDATALALLGVVMPVEPWVPEVAPQTGPVPSAEGVWQSIASGSPQILARFPTSIPGAAIGVTDVFTLPSGVPGLPVGRLVYAYKDLVPQGFNEQDVLAAYVTFFVEKSWLQANQVHEWSIQFSRFDEADVAWRPTTAKRVREDTERVFFSTAISRFSLWSISGGQSPPPVGFRVNNLTITPTEAVEGQSVTIEVDVANDAGVASEYVLALWLNSRLNATRRIPLAAGATGSLSFTLTPNAGSYVVRIDRLISSLKVNAIGGEGAAAALLTLAETDLEAAVALLTKAAGSDLLAVGDVLLALAAFDPGLAELLALVIGLAGQRVEVPRRTAPLAAQLASAEGEQVLNVSGWLFNIKPWREGGGNRPWMHWVYMPPFLFDENNELVQGFATAYTLSEDGRTYIFHLNPDAVFQNGSPLTAAAYKGALEFGVRPADQVGWGGSTLDLKLIEGADAAIAGETSTISGLVPLGDHDLAIRLIATTPTFPKRMATWLQGAFKAEAADADPDFFLHPIGVGPYEVTSYVPDVSLELTATGNWWEPKSIITKVIVQRRADPQTELTMFESGALDIIYGYRTIQPAVHDAAHPLNPFLVDIPYPGLAAFVRFDTAKEPFQDINIRRALAHAIDHASIIEAVYGSKDLRAKGVLQPETSCWDAGFQGYAFDPELARQYLAQSTYKTGENVPLLQIESRPGSYDWNDTLGAWQQAWKENLGIDFQIHLPDFGQPFPPGITPPGINGINMHRDSLGAFIPDPGFLLDWMVHTKSPFGVMHVNDALDARLDAANALRLDDPGRCAAFQAVELEFMASYYILPIIKLDFKFLVQPWVFGLQSSVNNDIGTLPYMKIGKRDFAEVSQEALVSREGLAAEGTVPTAPLLLIEDATATEGANATATVRVLLGRPSDGAITVTASAWDASSQETGLPTASTTLTWAAGESGGKTFDVPILDDDQEEDGERVTLTLTDATTTATSTEGVQVYGSTAALTIQDDEPTAKVVTITSENEAVPKDQYFLVVAGSDSPALGVQGIVSVTASSTYGMATLIPISQVPEILVKMHGLGEVRSKTSTHVWLATVPEGERSGPVPFTFELAYASGGPATVTATLQVVDERSNRNFFLFPGMNFTGLALVPDSSNDTFAELLRGPAAAASPGYANLLRLWRKYVFGTRSLSRSVALADVVEMVSTFDGAWSSYNTRDPLLPKVGKAPKEGGGGPTSGGGGAKGGGGGGKTTKQAELVDTPTELRPWQGMLIKTRQTATSTNFTDDVFETVTVPGYGTTSVPIKMTAYGPFLDPCRPVTHALRVGFNLVAPHIEAEAPFNAVFGSAASAPFGQQFSSAISFERRVIATREGSVIYAEVVQRWLTESASIPGWGGPGVLKPDLSYWIWVAETGDGLERLLTPWHADSGGP